jgi:hypothetical protein
MFLVSQLPDLEFIARRWIYKDLMGFGVKKKETKEKFTHWLPNPSLCEHR